MYINAPPMGWNTWNTFGPDINEELIVRTADAIVESGLKSAGYEYIIIDDAWSEKCRDENGCLLPDRRKFPHGMKYIGDYIHSKGLKFGIYSCAGYMTCAMHPGSYEHEWKDARSFAEWGVDYLKYDFCFHPTTVRPDILYKRMGLALANCGRDILYAVCSWGDENTRQWIRQTGAHSWRSTGDIRENWDRMKEISLSQLKNQEYNARGCFNDLDMLLVGMNGKGHMGDRAMSVDEYKTHFSLWALLGSPLIIGCDVRSMSEETRSILMNKEIIDVNQDPLYSTPFFANLFSYEINKSRGPEDAFYKSYPLDVPVIARYMNNGDIAIGIFNLTDSEIDSYKMTVTPDLLGICTDCGKILELSDLWTGEKFRSENFIIQKDKLAPHACCMLRAKLVDK